jgi:hypothetical protein
VFAMPGWRPGADGKVDIRVISTRFELAMELARFGAMIIVSGECLGWVVVLVG